MSHMSLIFETITPMFLGGADPRGDPEMRPPAIRGALRYWLRAALGGVIGDQDRNLLSALEGRVFGEADEKIGASAISLRLSNPAFQSIAFSSLIGENTHSKTVRFPGMAYLWFSARSTKRERERSGLMGKFHLEIQSRLGIKQAEERFEEAYLALWLWSHLGGLGSRARRAGGNLQIIKAEGSISLSQNLPLVISAKTPQEFESQLRSGINYCRKWLAQRYQKGKVSCPSSFDILDPSVCRIWVVNKTYQTWKEAVNEFGSIYQSFRSRRQPDYQTVKDALKSGKALSPPVERAAFGLPIQFYYSSLDGLSAGLQSEHYDRRSSPLSVRVVRLANCAYIVLLVWFDSVFLPPGEKLKLVSRGISVLGSLPDGSLIRRFVAGEDPSKKSSLADKGIKVIEVKYD